MSIVYETKWTGIHAWQRTGAKYMPQHAHDYVEVLYARGGAWTVYLNFKEYRLQKGDVFFAFPGQVHAHEATTHENIALLFPKDLPAYDSVFEHYIPQDPVLRGKVDAKIDTMFLEAVRANSLTTAYAKGVAGGYIALILGKLLPQLSLCDAAEHAASKEEKLIKYCAAHYKEQITLTSVAQALHYSPTHLSHLFKNKLQINFAKFITLLRIEDAKKMLRGEKPITQIAFDAGFASVRTFNQAFKAVMHMTPGQYREKYGKRGSA